MIHSKLSQPKYILELLTLTFFVTSIFCVTTDDPGTVFFNVCTTAVKLWDSACLQITHIPSEFRSLYLPPYLQ